MEWHDIFPTNMRVKLHHLWKKWGSVTPSGVTPSDNTNAVSKPEKGDQIVYGILPNI